MMRKRSVHPHRRPRIGVTGPDKGGLPAWLFTRIALFRAGGKAVRLRPAKFSGGSELPPIDALIIGGGADVDPGRYLDGIEAFRHEIDTAKGKGRSLRWWLSLLLAPVIFLIRSIFSLSASGLDPARDAFEQRCLEHSLGREIPILGICRGAQFINIHFEGTLHRGLEDFYGEAGNLDTVFPRKRVEIGRATRLHRVLDCDHVLVNSLHNQAVDRLGNGLHVSARDDAGVVQAIEKTSHPFLIGVQWHPEYLPLVRTQQKIFRELVRCAKG
jgi:putative glutamine amidotransferase